MPPKVKLADKLYGTLRQMVESGTWPEGARLPPETDLAQVHGVSRPVVREALIRLRADGVIGPRGGAGNYVLDGEAGDESGYRPIENVADLIQVFEFRFSLECDIASFAALRRDQSDLDEIQASAEALSLEGSEENFGDADFRFHIALARASRNEMFVTTLNMLRRQIVFGMRLVGEFRQVRTSTREETILQEHEAIVSAIVARNASDAATAMSQHITNSRKRLLGFDLPTEWQ